MYAFFNYYAELSVEDASGGVIRFAKYCLFVLVDRREAVSLDRSLALADEDLFDRLLLTLLNLQFN